MKYPFFYKKMILFITVAGFFYSCTYQKQEYNQDRIIELEITGGKTYNEMYIRPIQLSKTQINFAGETVNGYQWTFTIPDSIVKKTIHFELRSSESTPPMSIPTLRPTDFRRTAFIGVIQGDTLTGRAFHFENNEKHIYLKAKYCRTVHEVNYQYISSLDTTVAIQEWYEDHFLVDPNQNRFLRENMITPLGFFYESFGVEKYDDYLAKFAAKIKENPNSFYYMSTLASTTGSYKPKDVERLYNMFSDEMKSSSFGQMVYNDFSVFKINNVSLTNTDTKTEEKVVLSLNKYTLLIFSASWCIHCREKIPILKKIHKETNDVLDMVYITIDDEKTLSQWEELMCEENIPWRSLSSNDNKDLRNSWNINVGLVPDYILINPMLEAQRISLRDESDIRNLYSIIQNNRYTYFEKEIVL